jgi:hypothetical protein
LVHHDKDAGIAALDELRRIKWFLWHESMRFRGAAMEHLRTALIRGEVNMSEWRPPDIDSRLGAPRR